jgi:hypothetical protein
VDAVVAVRADHEGLPAHFRHEGGPCRLLLALLVEVGELADLVCLRVRDINHVKDAEEDKRVPVIDRLIEVLPTTPKGKPRLAVLGITHHDTDHCCGFGRLIGEAQVDELWLTLRSFVDAKNAKDGDGDELTEAGRDVYNEACRRRDCEIKAMARGERAAPGIAFALSATTRYSGTTTGRAFRRACSPSPAT